VKAIRTIKESNIKPDEAEIYRALLRHLRRRQGFGLLFVRCSPAQGQRVIEQIEEDLPQKKIATLFLDREIDNLYQLIEEKSTLAQIDILFIAGIEKSFVNYIKPGIGGQGDYYKLDTVPPLLGHLNLQRERFRDNFNFCLVFLVPLFGLKYLVRRSPDFYDWRSGVFEFPTDEEVLALEDSRVIEEEDYKQYLSLTPQERYEKILEIRELIDQSDLEGKGHLWRKIGHLYSAGKEYEEALASYDQALQWNADRFSAWFYRGLALGKLGRYEEALASYDKTLQLQPDYYHAWRNRGWVLRKLGRYEEAVASYDQALQLQPDYYQAWDNRGIALTDLGRYEEALASYDKALQKALQLKADYPNPYYNIACCYALQSKVELALENLQHGINLNKEYREIAKTDSDFDNVRFDPRFQSLFEDK
jgi:tetratricopeptide (TPR) repeat protein